MELDIRVEIKRRKRRYPYIKRHLSPNCFRLYLNEQDIVELFVGKENRAVQVRHVPNKGAGLKMLRVIPHVSNVIVLDFPEI